MVATRPYYTLDDYVRVEADSGVKHEFVGGQILAMAGGSLEHARLSANAVSALKSALGSSPCVVLSSDMRVGHEASDFRAYPDVSVVCGPPRYADKPAHTLCNPTCVVEVLSESTAAYDRGEKLEQYCRMESVQSVLLVSQESRSVTVFRRQGERFESVQYEAGDRLEIPGLPGLVPVDAIYD